MPIHTTLQHQILTGYPRLHLILGGRVHLPRQAADRAQGAHTLPGLEVLKTVRSENGRSETKQITLEVRSPMSVKIKQPKMCLFPKHNSVHGWNSFGPAFHPYAQTQYGWSLKWNEVKDWVESTHKTREKYGKLSILGPSIDLIHKQ